MVNNRLGIASLYKGSKGLIGSKGFTLAELLISLAIIAVIATFTIPKILSAQQNTKFNSEAKEVAAMMTGAYMAYRNDYPASALTKFADITPYMNYVKLDTSGALVDDVYGGGTVDCNPASFHWCLRMHNGSTLVYFAAPFGATNTTNAIYLTFDPDGVAQSTTNGPGKSVMLYMYFNGRLTSKAYLDPNAADGTGNLGGPSPANEPPWFSWN